MPPPPLPHPPRRGAHHPSAYQRFGAKLGIKSITLNMPDGTVIIVDGREEDLYYQGFVKLR